MTYSFSINTRKGDHMSIGNKKPMDVYNGEVPGKNLWKKTDEYLHGKK